MRAQDSLGNGAGDKMDYLEITNWHEYQHYTKRNPPWIKLHNKILDCYEYGCLQDASKLLLLSLYLLASRTDNKIPNDIDWIRSKAMLKGKIDLKPLLQFDFIKLVKNASETLATCMRSADAETETETETETDKRQNRKSVFGTFQNVKLTEEEEKKLQDKFGISATDSLIEELSEGIASKGYKYKDHYATVLNWARRKGYGKPGNDPVHDNIFLRPIRKEAGKNAGG
jgi:hypothetical protein